MLAALRQIITDVSGSSAQPQISAERTYHDNWGWRSQPWQTETRSKYTSDSSAHSSLLESGNGIFSTWKCATQLDRDIAKWTAKPPPRNRAWYTSSAWRGTAWVEPTSAATSSSQWPCALAEPTTHETSTAAVAADAAVTEGAEQDNARWGAHQWGQQWGYQWGRRDSWDTPRDSSWGDYDRSDFPPWPGWEHYRQFRRQVGRWIRQLHR